MGISFIYPYCLLPHHAVTLLLIAITWVAPGSNAEQAFKVRSSVCREAADEVLNGPSRGSSHDGPGGGRASQVTL